MLIDFSVKNYLSIKDKTVFSMICSDDECYPSIKIHRPFKNVELLPAVTIYGFNASGKSNLIKAMDLVKKFLIYSKINDQKLLDHTYFYYKPFKLDDRCKNKPSEFQIRLIAGEYIYDYFLSYDLSGVIEEKLLQIDSDDNYVELVQRYRDELEIDYDIDISIIKKVIGDDYNFKSVVGSVSFFDDNVKTFLDWIENDLVIIRNRFESKNELRKTINYLIEKDNKFHVKLIRTLSEISYSNIDRICADTIINTIRKTELDEDIVNDLKYKYLSKINRGITLDEFPMAIVEDFTINTYKKGIDAEGNEREVVFNLFEESKGTIKIYALYAYIYEALYIGKTLVIDEMTSYIHPLVSSYILNLFQNPIENEHGQLITSTHTTDLLEMKSLRKDQVYIADKDENETTLYSLADMLDVSNTENFRTAYLSGKYGGLNYFRREFYE